MLELLGGTADEEKKVKEKRRSQQHHAPLTVIFFRGSLSKKVIKNVREKMASIKVTQKSEESFCSCCSLIIPESTSPHSLEREAGMRERSDRPRGRNMNLVDFRQSSFQFL